MNIALLQIAAEDSLARTLDKGLSYCLKAQALGADLALFPEMYSSGYRIAGRPASDWLGEALPVEHPFVQAFGAMAAKLHMAIGITFLEAWDPAPRNSFLLFDRFGTPVLRYAKVHTCDFESERLLTPGEDFYVADLDTAEGVVKVGAMICFDREFPESARLLMLKGAELILVPNACPLELNRLAALRTRAYENMVCVATCSYPAGVPDCNGHSCVFDGAAWLPEAPGARDTCLLEAGGEEGVYLASLDLGLLRAYREREVQGNAYRRPGRYGLLCSNEIKPPFFRKDRRD